MTPQPHPDVIAGAATIVLEMLNDQPALDTLILPLGGGGLLAGAAIVARAREAIGAPMLVVGAECESSMSCDA
jgi:threonine dehydratase